MIQRPENTEPFHPEFTPGSISETIGKQDLAYVLSQFSIGKIQNIVKSKRGSRRSPKLRITTTDGQFLLKRRAIGRDDLEQVAISHSIQEHLLGEQFPVPGLVLADDGNTAVHREGRIYELFHYVSGLRFDYSNSQALEAGRVLGLFHNLLREYSPHPAMKSNSYHVGRRVSKLLDEINLLLHSIEKERALVGIGESLQYLDSQYKEAYSTVNKQKLDSLPIYIVHGDWHPGNLLYDNGRVVAVLDFDSVRLTPRVIDLANAVLQFSIQMGRPDKIEQWGEGFRLDSIESVLRGYSEVVHESLSDAEIATIPHLMVEALVVESLIPINSFGTFGEIPGSMFLKMVEKKIKWFKPQINCILKML